ncbi:hypothetical protein BAG01nite_18550 [Brevibacillus agri]|uniref:DUF4309 domain-containing protein n=1 Tax=Brevibacillus agri TaxID=51101 RepID=A0A3M8AXX5_9BACL|nr:MULTISPECIES: hypothetical protein [Brevibacillus]EJL47851.1 hypothetical protein PMI08_00034 [Brevibacillus sp. CF112]MBG9566657.1 hypothetical protein [Brevibacillus agri]MED3497651.1 hypothetical protein [Brevibacillus agri]QAV11775.1 hypothetical protein BA6348_02670 [Brevibacillus agri]QHZ54264.1 hypothetical protein M655_000460 [Brevibacillus sp. NSP2.1]
MRRLVCMAMAVMTASILAIGCSPEASVPVPPEAKPTDGQQPKPESPVQNENNGAGQNEANNEKPLPAEQPGLTAQLILDDNFLKLLANNEINGFDIAIGMKKEEVVKRYGAVVKKDFLDGGQYAVLEKLDDGIVFFDGADRVYAIDLEGSRLGTATLEAIQQGWGTPVDEGESMVDGEYLLLYEAGDNSVFISAENKNSPPEKIRIINKKMLDEFPQKF